MNALLFIAAVFAPCAESPPGMVCIPGGPAIVGSDDGPAAERPKRTIEISTFYLDAKETTQSEYDQCVKAGACEQLPKIPPKLEAAFRQPNVPAVSVDWYRADKYCRWAGKRLPTEWEWEKAARGPSGDTYSWGNDEPACNKAHFRECAPKKGECVPMFGKKTTWDCIEHATKPVGSFAPGHYGLYDMGGNGYEWTSTWYTADASTATGLDPLGPCDGAPFCKAIAQRKVLRGGSWYWPANQTRGAHRRPERMKTGTHRLSVRCAASSPKLTGFPTKQGVEKRAAPPALQPPSAELIRLAQTAHEDPGVKLTCDTPGRSFETCRDPQSYTRSNETRRYLWRPYIENLGGGYVGVGIDQNYSFMASARSEWAWLVDYDPLVVRLHKMLKKLVLHAESPQAFVALFSPKKAALQVLDDASDKALYLHMRATLSGYYAWQMHGFAKDRTFGWLATPEAYTHVRTMFQQDRVQMLRGDMLAKEAFASVASAATKMGVPIRIYYPSNAPECWELSAQYKKNVQALPFDASTVVLHTLSAEKTGFLPAQSGHWHYNVQNGFDYQRKLAIAGFTRLKQLVWDRVKTDDRDLTACGFERSAAPGGG